MQNRDYIQCMLEKDILRRIAWIPVRYAKKGKVLNIAGDNGWKVISVYALDTEEDMKKRQQNRKYWRKHTDA